MLRRGQATKDAPLDCGKDIYMTYMCLGVRVCVCMHVYMCVDIWQGHSAVDLYQWSLLFTVVSFDYSGLFCL